VATVFLQLVWQVDDAYGFEGAFFDADSAAAAEYLGYDGFVSFNSYSFHSAAHHRAEANAGLIALFDFASVLVKYSDSRHDLAPNYEDNNYEDNN
jgi:hypothetical protein